MSVHVWLCSSCGSKMPNGVRSVLVLDVPGRFARRCEGCGTSTLDGGTAVLEIAKVIELTREAEWYRRSFLTRLPPRSTFEPMQNTLGQRYLVCEVHDNGELRALDYERTKYVELDYDGDEED